MTFLFDLWLILYNNDCINSNCQAMSKPLKLIQLNCLQFIYFDKILKFLKEQNPDIINLQEATSGNVSDFGKGVNLEKLAQELGMTVFFKPFTATESENGEFDWFGNAILTRLEIIDSGTHWLLDGQKKTGILTNQENNKIQERIKINRNLAYPIVFSQPKNLIWTLLKHNGKVFRNITTHFTVSQKCTETLQMIQETQSVCDFLDNVKDIPTFFTGDLNIHQQAGCITNLKSKMQLVNQDSVNTLTPAIHQIFEPKYQELDPGLKNGLSVDYVFQKNIKIINSQIPNVEVSDHLPIVVEFEI
jgi:endonuclease/exonuclease/phosphatase family metal-dependent hydrolase